MKRYVQFMTLSTGYTAGSTPPQFSDDNKCPIELLGSDGVVVLDGRLSIDSCVNVVHDVWSKRLNKDQIIGFDIIRSESFTNERHHGQVIYSYLQP